MQWHNRLWLGSWVALCCLLLIGCPGDQTAQEDRALPEGGEPTIEELGLRLVPEGVALDLTGLSPAAVAQVARGSYLVNGVGGCSGCHSSPAGYLAGGVEFALPFADSQGFTSVVGRNLTPDPETGFDHTETEFIEIMRTGIDFDDSTAAAPQRLIIMPWHIFRFMALDDLRAIFAFLQHIPAVRHALRTTFIPPFPFPPIPYPGGIGDGDPVGDPDNAARGLLIPRFFSSGPDADAFVAQFNAQVDALPLAEQARVGRGSYLVNALGDCNNCHTDGSGDGNFDSGLLPFTVNVNTAAYLAGGVNLGIFFGAGDLFSRNLTPDPGTGMMLTETEFVQCLRFGADFRRPGGSLRVPPHFPSEFHMTLDDLEAIFAYLQVVPAVVQEVEIVP